MDRLAAMRAFVTVVEEGGFTAAAARLRTSKSAVSAMVRDLEADLGVALLTRTTRRFNLTEAGARFKARAEQILADVEEASAEASALTRQPRGQLRLSAGVSFGTLHLGCAVATFCAQYPGMEVDINLSDRFVDLVEEGFDVAVRIGSLSDSSLVARRLSHTHRVVVASPAYLNEHGTPSRPEELTRHNCLGYSLLASGVRWRFVDDGRVMDINVTGRLSSNNGDLLRDAAVNGVGLYMAPTFIVHEDLRAGRLVPVLTRFMPPPLDIHAVFPASRYVSGKLRAFVDHLVDHFRGPPRWEEGLDFIVQK
jgi:DNA-binding transcriptional LysR family regulator